MNYSPKVSVVVPIYNVEKYIERCLESLYIQSLKELEVILVNDGTKDKSGEICKKFIEKNKLENTFHYYEKENGGLSDARNYGLKFATGEYICFLDSDDYVDKDIYETMYNKAKQNESIIAECEFYFTYEKKEKRQQLPNKYKNINDYIINSSVVAWNKIIKRTWLLDKEILFAKGLQYEDVNFFFKVCCNIKDINEICTINIPMIHYVQRKNSITSKVNKKLKEIVYIYQDIIEYAKNNNKYEILKEEIEYKMVRNLYCAFYRKALQIKQKEDRKEVLNLFINSVEKNFPRWKYNRYLKRIDFTNLYLKIVTPKILLLFARV